MGVAYEFLRECGVFFVATVNDRAPAVRPFGAVMEYDGELYISTANTKNVYAQMKANSYIQIVAHKAGTRDWIRIDGNAVEVHDSDIKQRMLKECPVLVKHFGTADCEIFALFRVSEIVGELRTGGEMVRL